MWHCCVLMLSALFIGDDLFRNFITRKPCRSIANRLDSHFKQNCEQIFPQSTPSRYHKYLGLVFLGFSNSHIIAKLRRQIQNKKEILKISYIASHLELAIVWCRNVWKIIKLRMITSRQVTDNLWYGSRRLTLALDLRYVHVLKLPTWKQG